MKSIFLKIIIILFFLSSCSKTKTVLICGDHKCVNKLEAEQFFEENLTIEIKVINKRINKKFDLVQLNLNEDLKGKQKINLINKKKTNESLINLSDEEILKIKRNVKNKQKEKNTKKNKNKEIAKLKQETNKINDNIIKNQKDIKKNKKNIFKDLETNKYQVVDICKIIKKCNIDEISKYLIIQEKKKDYPDITKR